MVVAAGTDPSAERPLLSDGAINRRIGSDDLDRHVATLTETYVEPHLRSVRPGQPARVLLVPPDHTRLHSRAGEITASFFARLAAAGHRVGVLPATGTHRPMTPADADLLFGPGIPFDQLLVHDWRGAITTIGTFDPRQVARLTDGRLRQPFPVEVSDRLLDEWDLVISIGQVLPHEVIGMANYTKNLLVGLGGPSTIDNSHFLGAISDMETLMGRPDGPVRALLDEGFRRFLQPRLSVLWVLTVVEATGTEVVQRGFFAGWSPAGSSEVSSVGTPGLPDSGPAAYREAAELSTAVNISFFDRPLPRVVCWLDPTEFRSTWLANKAIYRTRLALADGGELVVLAPGVHTFGEDDDIDRLIRRHGYRGVDACLRAVERDPDLAANLAAAAHLIHGSSEGRFAVTYCTDPDTGGLAEDEVTSVGFGWRPLRDELELLALDGTGASGQLIDRAGQAFWFINNPALGLWADRARFASEGSGGL